MKLVYFIDGNKEDDLKAINLQSKVQENCFIGDMKYFKKNGDSITAIGESAFKNLTDIQKITLPTEVEELEESAFENCKDLRLVKYDGQKLAIRQNAFKNCNKLETLILHENDKTQLSGVIAKNAFAGCTALHTVVLLGQGDMVIYPDAFCHSRDVTFVVSKDSQTERFAIGNGIRCISVEECEEEDSGENRK